MWPVTNENNVIVGGSIYLFDEAADGTDCTTFRSITLAHEIGHVLGLAEAREDECSTHIMYGTAGGLGRYVHDTECQTVNDAWTTSQESCQEYCRTQCWTSCTWNYTCPPVEYIGTPILIDLEGHGFHLSGVDDPVMFDLDADETRDRIAWTAKGADEGFLVLDRNHNASLTMAVSYSAITRPL